MAARGQYAKGAVKREEILRTALAVLSRNGYHSTSLRELADAAGLSQAGLLHYFDSKEELYSAILKRRDEIDEERYVDGTDDLATFVTTVRHNAEVPGLVHLYSTLSAAASEPGNPTHEFFSERYRWARDRIAAGVRSRQEAGRFRSDIDADVMATVVLATADGMQVQWLLDPALDMAKHIEALLMLMASRE
jgi:AcrR family transcriptional regulator